MIAFGVIALLHAAFCLYLAFTWQSIKVFSGEVKRRVKVTVLVPVRNESENILHLLKALNVQSYDKDFFEVIVVDDHSEDDTLDKLGSQTDSFDINLKTLRLQGGRGKKYAIEYGVSHATGELILCTDGDCLVPKKWIETFVAYFQHHDSKLVSGPVKMDSKNWFGHYQALDFSTLIGFGAATLQRGVASTCNGANMAYLKSVFVEVNGYDGNTQIPTGDDEFLLQKVHQKYPRSVHFLKSEDAMVTTQPKPNAGAFVQQRIRWSSKWRFHQSPLVKGAAVFAYFDFLTLLLLLWLTLFHAFPVYAAMAIVAFRWFAEAIYLHKTTAFFSLNASGRHYAMVSFIYPFYIFFLGFASIFGHYSWKGRSY